MEPMPTKNAYQLYAAIALALKMSKKIARRESLLVETPQKFLSWLAAMLNAEPVVKAVMTVSERMFVTKPRRKTPKVSKKIPLMAEVVIMVRTYSLRSFSGSRKLRALPHIILTRPSNAA